MMQDHKYTRGIADSGWYQIQRFTKYKAEWAGKMVDFVDPTYTSQICSRCGKLVERMQNTAKCCQGDVFRCPFCGLEINVHQNAAINIRNRSEVYQRLMDKTIYQRLTEDLKGKTGTLEKRLSSEVFCYENKNRYAIARIYAFGEMTSTQIEISEQAASLNKEIVLSEGKNVSKLSSIQAVSFDR
jgi:predicted RNA-binding Zn-ribbon protein involved in translation (DUF1610 family)